MWLHRICINSTESAKWKVKGSPSPPLSSPPRLPPLRVMCIPTRHTLLLLAFFGDLLVLLHWVHLKKKQKDAQYSRMCHNLFKQSYIDEHLNIFHILFVCSLLLKTMLQRIFFYTDLGEHLPGLMLGKFPNGSIAKPKLSEF